ncbi:MAG: ureidoglycolate lyase [Acidimicrobiales bacterium]
MQDVFHSIEAEPFDSQAWEPFGWIPRADTDPRDGESRLDFSWGDVHVNHIAHTADEITHTHRGLRCDMLFRHHTHTQALLVLNSFAVMAAAPAACSFKTAADADQVRAFVLQPHDSFVLAKGTWHWGPFPVGSSRVDLFNVQSLRYAEDNDCARLDQLRASLEIVTGDAEGPAHERPATAGRSNWER